MPVKVTCDDCGTKFSIGDDERSAACPTCGTPKRKPKKSAGDAPASPGRKCSVCQKPLGPGVKFCVSCGTSVETIDAGTAAVAGMQLDEQSERNKAWYRWQRFLWGFLRW